MSLACRGRYATEADGPDRWFGSHQHPTVPVAIGPAQRFRADRDGGLATELEARGHDLSDPLWSARLLAEAPQEIAAVHAAYLSRRCHDRDHGQLPGVVRRLRRARNRPTTTAVRAAAPQRRTRQDRARRSRRCAAVHVAASIGPYGAALADGSEYRGRYGLSVARLKRWHRPRLEVLADAGADVLALETVPDVDEAEALVNLVRSVGVPAWLSYTIDGTATRAGQPLADAFAVAAGVPRDRRDRRQLLCARRRAARDPAWPGNRQAGDRLPEQRRALGRRRRAWIGPRRGFPRSSPCSGPRPALASSAAAAACGPPTSRMFAELAISAKNQPEIRSAVHVRRIVRPSARRASGTPARCR